VEAAQQQHTDASPAVGSLGAVIAPSAPAGRDEVPNGARTRRWHRTASAPGEPRTGYLYILPALVLYLAFVVVPLGHAVYLSFTNWNGLTPAKWVGLANYRNLVSDPELRSAFAHSAELVVFISILPLILGLLLASTLATVRTRGLSVFRTVLFIPQVLPLVVVGVAWRWIYDPSGPLNAFLRAVGLGSVARAWLGDFGWALRAVGLVGTWVTYGFAMVLFIAGVQKIPTSLYDAARVDGAGPLHEFFAVTLPGLRNELLVVLVLTMISALRTFDVIYVTTQGGPGTATTVPSLEIYNNAFQYNEVGAAAAVSVVLALLIFAIAVTILRVGERGS
jgi:raffinose/stachyose/melibiose transport system permease protein